MKVSRLPVDTGPAAWNELLPEQDPAVTLDSDQEADYLVIGAGFAGLSAARRLSQIAPTARIIVLEAKRVGEGPAGRNSGFMIDLPHNLSSTDYASTLENDKKQIALSRRAIEFATEAAAEYGIPEETFDPRGKINGAVGETAHQHNLNYAEHLSHLGETCELLDDVGMRELTGSNFYRSGLYTPGTVLIQPAAYIRSLAGGLRSNISLFENSPVTSLQQTQGSWIAEAAAGTVRAQKVILATNGHIESFGFFKRRVFHVILYASMTRALTKDEDKLTGSPRWGITPADPAATTMRKFTGTGGTRIITRNQMSYAPTLKTSNSVVAKMAARHEHYFKKRYPELGYVEQEYAWSGRLCMSRNSVPAFGKLDDGLYSACCQNGLGTSKGTLNGMAVAELAAEGETELVRAVSEQGSPTKLPPAPLDSLGANAFMRWSEFKARSEL